VQERRRYPSAPLEESLTNEELDGASLRRDGRTQQECEYDNSQELAHVFSTDIETMQP
jgi:hypothetical protein